MNEAVTAGSVDIGLAGSSPVSRGLSNKLSYQVPWIFDVIGEAGSVAQALAQIPALRPDVITLCKRYSIPVFSGAFTPTEIINAWEAGADAACLGFGAGVAEPVQGDGPAQQQGVGFGIGAVQQGLKGPWIDGHEQISFLDHLAGLEVNLINVTTHARTNLHGLRSVDAAGELIPFLDFLLNRRGNADAWRWHLHGTASALIRLVAAREQ